MFAFISSRCVNDLLFARIKGGSSVALIVSKNGWGRWMAQKTCDLDTGYCSLPVSYRQSTVFSFDYDPYLPYTEILPNLHYRDGKSVLNGHMSHVCSHSYRFWKALINDERVASEHK